jgi:hypothetical protein
LGIYLVAQVGVGGSKGLLDLRRDEAPSLELHLGILQRIPQLLD